MPKGFRLNKRGLWYHEKGTPKGGKIASNAEVEAAFLRDAGYFQNKAGRYQKVAGGQFATKAEIEAAKTGGANERINLMEWNKIKNNTDDYKGFLSWTKDAWTGRNRGQDRTQAILQSTGTSNMSEAFKAYKQSKAGLLYESIKRIDAATLIKEFSDFLDRDMTAYINELRAMTKEERYDEAKAQQAAYIATYSR